MSLDSEEPEIWEKYCCLKRCSGTCSEPVANRTRSSLRQLNEILQKEETTHELTILDKLNEDCWRIVFSYLNVEQLIHSERVSRQWRLMVQRYLQGLTICLRSSRYHYHPSKPLVICQKLTVPPRHYLGIVEKFGRAILVADCFDAAGLKALGTNCPDIQDLRIHEPRFHQVKNVVVHFNKLKRVSFENVIHLKDDYVSRFLQINTPDEVVISKNTRILGSCFIDLKTDLKSLGLHSCSGLYILCLLLASNRLTNLTELRMNGNSTQVLEDVFLLIEHTPKLECLCLEWYTLWEDVNVGNLVDAICQLRYLKYLSFHDNDCVKDEWLEPIGQCCKQLRIVDIGGCLDVTAAGIDALCRGAAKTLAVLDISSNEKVTNDNLLRWIYQCPKLEILDVIFVSDVTGELIGKCRQAVLSRPRALRLRVFGTMLRLKKKTDGKVLFADGNNIQVLETNSNLILDFSRDARMVKKPKNYNYTEISQRFDNINFIRDRFKNVIFKPPMPPSYKERFKRPFHPAWMDYCDPYHCNDYHKVACGVNRRKRDFKWFQSGCHIILNNNCASFRGNLKYDMIDPKFCRSFILPVRQGCGDCEPDGNIVCAVSLVDNRVAVFRDRCAMIKTNCAPKTFDEYEEVDMGLCAYYLK